MSGTRWLLWRAQHPDLGEGDDYVESIGDLISELLPTSDTTLKRLATDDRVWRHSHGTSEGSVAESVQATLTSLIIDHLDTLTMNVGRPG